MIPPLLFEVVFVISLRLPPFELFVNVSSYFFLSTTLPCFNIDLVPPSESILGDDSTHVNEPYIMMFPDVFSAVGIFLSESLICVLG